MRISGLSKPVRFMLIQGNALFPFVYPFLQTIAGLKFITGFSAYYRDYFLYGRLNRGLKSPFEIKFLNSYPFYYDRYEEAGGIMQHYFHQDIWAANRIHKSGVKKHYDIGSRLDGFISHCLVFCKVVMLDIRPLQIKILNLEFIQADCTDMKNIRSNSINSISSLHAIEHFGLGRYGDPVDPWGYKKAIDEMKRVVKIGGNIYFSVPIGKQRLEFNAHRVFNPLYVLELFDGFKLIEFSAVDENNNFIKFADPKRFVNGKFSCGLFHFKKISILK